MVKAQYNLIKTDCHQEDAKKFSQLEISQHYLQMYKMSKFLVLELQYFIQTLCGTYWRLKEIEGRDWL